MSITFEAQCTCLDSSEPPLSFHILPLLCPLQLFQKPLLTTTKDYHLQQSSATKLNATSSSSLFINVKKGTYIFYHQFFPYLLLHNHCFLCASFCYSYYITSSYHLLVSYLAAETLFTQVLIFTASYHIIIVQYLFHITSTPMRSRKGRVSQHTNVI